jgi:hypothetical protein
MMQESASADAVDAAVELILLQGLLESVTTKTEAVRCGLVALRTDLLEVARLSAAVMAQVSPPNPVRTDMEEIHSGALALLALPSLSFLDY